MRCFNGITKTGCKNRYFFLNLYIFCGNFVNQQQGGGKILIFN